MSKIRFIPKEELYFKTNSFQSLSQTQSWSHSLIGINELWEVSDYGKNIKIAVLDSGYSEHDDLKDSWCLENCYDCTFMKDAKDYSCGHGIHVAGIISANNNSFGVVGVAPKSSIISIKVLDSNGSGSFNYIADGLRKAIDLKVDIINMSLGTSQTPPFIIHNLIKEAVSKGIIVVAASGNDSKSVNYPAKYDEVIAVGALDQNKKICAFTSKDNTLDLLAPGSDIYSTFLNNSYSLMSGTSQASPFIAGLCALIKSALKNLNLLEEFGDQFCQEDMMRILKNISKIGDDSFYIPETKNLDWKKILL